MSEIYYGNKTISEIDSYYKINIDGKWTEWDNKRLELCEKIQRAFTNHAILLAVRECEDLYKIYSDEYFCGSWESGLEEMTEQQIFDLLLPILKDVINDRITRLYNVINELEINGYIKLEGEC